MQVARPKREGAGKGGGKLNNRGPEEFFLQHAKALIFFPKHGRA